MQVKLPVAREVAQATVVEATVTEMEERTGATVKAARMELGGGVQDLI